MDAAIVLAPIPLAPLGAPPPGGGLTECGAAHASCRATSTIPGGTYARSYEVASQSSRPVHLASPATVSPFELDTYLVTVGRFRQFVDAWTKGYRPPAGSGKHAHLHGGRGLADGARPGAFEPGWRAADAASVAPDDASLACGTNATWTTAPASREDYPINCLTWAEAYAFCIWDGGFLPTEAEWGYVAAGGSVQRALVWGAKDTLKDADAGAFGVFAQWRRADGGAMAWVSSIGRVGMEPRGAARWGALDMAGDVEEWTLDAYAPYAEPCVDCLGTRGAYRVVRGGSFANGELSPWTSGLYPPAVRSERVGVRCARRGDAAEAVAAPVAQAAPSAQPSASASPSAAASPAASLCARVDREQRELMEKVRRAASKLHPEWVREGSDFRDRLRPDASDGEYVAVRQRAYAQELAATPADPLGEPRWILDRSPVSDTSFVKVSSSLYPAGVCLPSGRGAWSLEASDVLVAPGDIQHWSAKIKVGHYDDALHALSVPFTTCCGEMYDGELQNSLPVLFDYDGDGEAEVYVHATEFEKRVEVGGSEWGYLYTFKNGAIVRYPGTEKLELADLPKDVDHDGRPDLFTHARVLVTWGPPDGCGDEPQMYAPTFLVHSRADGTFSMIDDVAKAYTRKWCPARPAAITSLDDAGCARLWASTPELVASEKARVAASCVELDPAACGGPHPANAVHFCGLRGEAFAGVPPFTLP